MNLLNKLKGAAKRIQRDSLTVYFIARDRDTPTIVGLLALAVAAYAISPIDLIPDFIPVLGYLDDLILLPLGILAVIKLTSKPVIDASRARAATVAARPISQTAAVVVVALWLLCAMAVVYWLWPWIESLLSS